MRQHQHLRIVDAAQRDADKIVHANADRHPHPVQGTTQHDAFAMKFDAAYTAVRTAIMRFEAYGQRKRVEPQRAARPRGIISACCCCLTPPGLLLFAGLLIDGALSNPTA
jgi:hypothetical protein